MYASSGGHETVCREDEERILCKYLTNNALQRLHDCAATTSQCKSNDRTMLQTLRKGLGIPGKSRTFVGNENNLIRL